MTMKDYTEDIEKFLKGQMSKQEEDYFKSELKLNSALHLQVFAIVVLIKSHSIMLNRYYDLIP